MTGLTLRNLGPKGIAKKAAKHTGKLMYEDWTDAKRLKGENGTKAVNAAAAKPAITHIPTQDDAMAPPTTSTDLYPKFWKYFQT